MIREMITIYPDPFSDSESGEKRIKKVTHSGELRAIISEKSVKYS